MAIWPPSGISDYPNEAALPTLGNADGDLAITLNDYVVWIWEAAANAWFPIAGPNAVQDAYAPLFIEGYGVGITQASTSTDGYLTHTDWNIFNNKVTSVSASAPLSSSGGTTPNITTTTGSLTETISDVLTITGTNTLFAATTIKVTKADASHDGYISSADWTSFNAKPSGSGTTNKVTKWTSSSALGNSIITDDGTTVTVGGSAFDVSGSTPIIAATAADGTILTIKGNVVSGSNLAGGSISLTAGPDTGSGVGGTSPSGVYFVVSDESAINPTTPNLAYTTGIFSNGLLTIKAKATNVVGGLYASAKVTLGDASGLYNVGITVPTLSAAWTMTLPGDGGTSNYVLKTNGSGVTGWASVGSVGAVTGSGTTNTIPKFTSSTVLGNSDITDDGTTVTSSAPGGLILSGLTGSFYNEGIRVGVSSDNYSMIAIGAVAGTSGTGVGQWTLIRNPSPYTFALRYNATDKLTIDTSGNAVLAGNSTIAGSFTMDGATSGTFTQQAAGTTTSYTVTWPSAQSSGTKFLQNDGAGNLSWSTSAITTGNLTDAGTDGITITGGTGAVIGSGTTISQHVADASHNGYLSSSDWTSFHNATLGVWSYPTTGSAFGGVNGRSTASVTGIDNTVIGQTNFSLTSGASNILIGTNAGAPITTGSDNVIIGDEAGSVASTSLTNAVIIGFEACQTPSGDKTIAIGANALNSAGVTGARNIGIGYQAGLAVTSAADNTFVGNAAGSSATGGTNVALGSAAGTSLTSGTGNVYLGYNTTASSGGAVNEVVLGAATTKIWIGNPSGSATAKTIQPTSASGLDLLGAALILTSSAGTGQGDTSLSYISLRTPTAGASGSTVQTLTERLKVATDAIYASVPYYAADGAVGSPSYAFTNDTSTGFYRVGASEIGVTLGGVKCVDFSTSSLASTILVDIKTAGSNYNEGIRVHPSTNNDYASLVLGAVSGTVGTGAGQWTLIRYPTSGFNNKFSIRYNTTDELVIDTSGNVSIATLTASRAVATDSSNNLVSSSTTDTELGYVHGVTSAIQTQINSLQTQINGKANTSLNNLASTAVNADIIPAANNTSSLGSGTLGWKDGYFNQLDLVGSGSGILSHKAAASTTSYTLTWPAAVTATDGYVLSSDHTGALSWIANGSGGGGTITGSGTANTVTKWTSATVIGNSSLGDDGTIITTNVPVQNVNSLSTSTTIVSGDTSVIPNLSIASGKTLTVTGALTSLGPIAGPGVLAGAGSVYTKPEKVAAIGTTNFRLHNLFVDAIYAPPGSASAPTIGFAANTGFHSTLGGISASIAGIDVLTMAPQGTVNLTTNYTGVVDSQVTQTVGAQNYSVSFNNSSSANSWAGVSYTANYLATSQGGSGTVTSTYYTMPSGGTSSNNYRYNLTSNNFYGTAGQSCNWSGNSDNINALYRNYFYGVPSNYTGQTLTIVNRLAIDSSATFTQITGLDIGIDAIGKVSGTATVTTYYGLKIEAPGTGVTLTNAYGLYVDTSYSSVMGFLDVTSAVATNYGEGIRIHASSDSYAICVLGATAGLTGTGAGQWTQIKNPSNQYTLRYNSTDMVIIPSGGTSIQFTQYANGTMSFTGANGTITTSSDARLKTVVDGYLPGLNEVLQLEPRFYKWNSELEREAQVDSPEDEIDDPMASDHEDRSDVAETHLGFIAQEVGKIIPEALGLPGSDGYYGLFDRPIIAALVQAVKELSAKVDALETKLGAKS